MTDYDDHEIGLPSGDDYPGGDGDDDHRHPLADGTTIVYTPSARRIGALLRAKDLDRRALFAPFGGAVSDDRI